MLAWHLYRNFFFFFKRQEHVTVELITAKFSSYYSSFSYFEKPCSRQQVMCVILYVQIYNDKSTWGDPQGCLLGPDLVISYTDEKNKQTQKLYYKM